MTRTRIVLADDCPTLRTSVAGLLQREGFDVVGEASDGGEAVTLAQTLEPDVVILDLVMPVLDGINAGRQLQQVTPGARLILLTVYTTADAVFAAVHSGFLGCVAKSDAVEDLGRAIREVLLGRIFLSRKPASAVQALLFGEPDIQSPGRTGISIDERR